METVDTFFEDLKVVELASVLAGPAVGLFFAELGAEVIKIENKTTGGDVTRNWRLPKEDKTAAVSAYYCSVNARKTSLLLDLTDQSDKAVALKHIQKADILISNFRPSAAKKMGLDYDSLARPFPKLIYAQLYGFNETDNRPAFDVALQAEAGFLYMNGAPNQASVKMPVALIDLLAAHQLKEGILTALLKRYKSGKGSFLSVSLLQAAIASLANQATNWLIGGHIPQKMGTAHPNIAPYGDIIRSQDGVQIVLAVGTERQFVGLTKVLKQEDLLDNPKFDTNKNRVDNREKLLDILLEAAQKMTSETIINGLEKHSVPYGKIRDMPSVFEQAEAKEMVEEHLIEGQKVKTVRSIAFKITSP